MTLTNIQIQGGLFSADFLDRIHEKPGQKPKDFGLEGNRPLVDEVSAVWSDARVYWNAFQRRLGRSHGESAATITREQWMIPLLEALGYTLTFQKRSAEVEGRTYALSHRAGEDESAPPVHIVGCDQNVGTRSGSGRGHLSPHALVQEYLNRAEHLWGVVTNGYIFRVLRDSSHFTRPTYIEFDLEQILKGERFDEFIVFYRLVHRTRLPRAKEEAAQCWLERYHQEAIDQGGRIRDGLRVAVEEAIQTLANGLLSHPKNESLRKRVRDKTLTEQAFYQEILYLIYRFLFLMVAEERYLLTSREEKAAGQDQKSAYYRNYWSISRLRERSRVPASAPERFDDLYLGLQTLFVVLRDDRLAEHMGLAPLNGELFRPLDTIDNARLNNRDLLRTICQLSYFTPTDVHIQRRVNYAALDVEELGSVYESLLEFQPQILEQNGRLTFQFGIGTERKSTGSYYTRPDLVRELIESALVPVIGSRLAEAKSQEDKEQALLSLKVCDPACGSGHFLLAAARRIGRELAKVRTAEEEPSPETVRKAIRDVIIHCIYGVDKNPLAVDLCKVALWIEGHGEGRPLTFLDHRIRCGDSLIGVLDMSVLKAGIPDEAFNAVSGDDKDFAKVIKAQNKRERKAADTGQMTLAFDARSDLATFAERLRRLETLTDDTPDQIREKARLYQELRGQQTNWYRDHTACNLWTSAFFALLTKGTQTAVPTTGVLESFLDRGVIQGQIIGWAEALALKQKFFHWPLEFPEVFAQGGFDLILSNPPWGQKIMAADERLKKFVHLNYPSASGIFDWFRPFTELATRLLVKGGVLGLVLPDILLLKNYEETRKFVLNTLEIVSIGWWPKPFPEVVMDAITFVAKRVKVPENHQLRVTLNLSAKPSSRIIPQYEFSANPRYVFNIFLTPVKRSILEKLERNPRLGDLFEIHEGVHSGNMRSELFVRERIDESCRPLLFGRKEIIPYGLRWEGYFIRLSVVPKHRTRERYANVGKHEWHEKRKVLVRRTGDYVLAAVDEEGRYASNNYFILFPKNPCGLTLEGICALLNSRFITWYFRTIEPRQGRVFAELKIKHIQSFPVPKEVVTATGFIPLNDLGKKRGQLAQILLSGCDPSERDRLTKECEHLDSEINALVEQYFGIDIALEVNNQIQVEKEGIFEEIQK
jgi:hypothetical protein